MTTTLDPIERQARLLARENRQSEPDIQRVYGFPDEREVRLISVTEIIPPSEDGKVQPFYFRPDPVRQLPFPSGIAMIRPAEFGHLELPEHWGDWSGAVLLEPGEAK